MIAVGALRVLGPAGVVQDGVLSSGLNLAVDLVLIVVCVLLLLLGVNVVGVGTGVGVARVVFGCPLSEESDE